MNAALTALRTDVVDLASALHLVADGAAQRGDDDLHNALQLLARHAEVIQEQLERLSAAECFGDGENAA